MNKVLNYWKKNGGKEVIKKISIEMKWKLIDCSREIQHKLKLDRRNSTKVYKINYNHFLCINKNNNYKNNNYKNEKILENSKKIINHNFNILGCSRNFGFNIEWNKDYKSNFKWEKKYFKKININNTNYGIDIKMPWELSRMQHLIEIGKAYFISKDCELKDEIIKQVLSWIDDNPYKRSVNWICAMDVAIRAINIITTLELIGDLQEKEQKVIDENLYLHGKFIWENLEIRTKNRNNHYISNLAGLFWISIYFNKLNKEVGKWNKFSIIELEKEIKMQINNDGTCFEGSTSYHRLDLELFLYTAILSKKNNIKFSTVFNQKLYLMCKFIRDITMSNNLVPNIGDMDDGRLFILSDYYTWSKSDFRYILAIASHYFHDKELKIDENMYEEELLIYGNINLEYHRTKEGFEAYKDGGYYILKNNYWNCVIRCGEMAMRGHGGHSHNEQLSICLVSEEDYLFIDPGTYSYTFDYDMRNKFRSTDMHNTVKIGGLEQNTIDPVKIFELEEETYADCLRFEKNYFLGKHIGYMSKCGVEHQREIKINENILEIKDMFLGDINIDKEINFILPINIGDISIIEEKKILIKNEFFFESTSKIEVTEEQFSESYGKLMMGTRIRMNTINDNHKIKVVRIKYE